MKIERNEIHKMKKELLKIPYKVGKGTKASIVFPISNIEVKNYDGIEMVAGLNKEQSLTAEPDAVLVLIDTGEGTKVELAYCDMRFAKKFDLALHCDLLGSSLPKKLDGIEAYLLENSYILTTFEL